MNNVNVLGKDLRWYIVEAEMEDVETEEPDDENIMTECGCRPSSSNLSRYHSKSRRTILVAADNDVWAEKKSIHILGEGWVVRTVYKVDEYDYILV